MGVPSKFEAKRVGRQGKPFVNCILSVGYVSGMCGYVSFGFN